MNLSQIKAGNFVVLTSGGRYYICKINGFTKDLIIPGNGKIQVTAFYPKSEIYSNTTLSYETLQALEVRDVLWNRAEKLMKLIYG